MGCGNSSLYEVFCLKKKIFAFLSYVLVATLASAITLGVTYRKDQTKLEQLLQLVEDQYVDDVDMTAVRDAAAYGIVSSLGDRWSYYIPASEYADYMEQMHNAYVGVGITITVNADGLGFDILSVEPEGPAFAAGILPGDILTHAQGQSVAGMTSTAVRNIVRGEEGTFVELTVLRGERELVLSVERRSLKTTVAEGVLLDGNIGLVRIYNFDDRCADESIAAIEMLMEQGADKIVFDVRNNGGGYAHEMVELLDYLLPQGDLFRTVDYAGRENVDTSDKACLDVPMAVLVNADSYSAAEFFAAALRDYDAAVIVGEQTSGKGYFQNTFKLNDGSAVALSTGKYFTPKGISLEGVGITPDVVLTLGEEEAMQLYLKQLAPQDDAQLQAAIAVLGG